MPTRETSTQRGSRVARRLLIRTGEELRIARVGAGLSLRTVAAEVGISHTQVQRIERAVAPHVDIDTLARLAAVLGHDLSIGVHPVASPLRDAAHVALLERLHRRLSPTLRWQTEVPMPIPGDLRSADATIVGPGVDVLVEAETHLDDVQAVTRRITGKQRDLATERTLSCCSSTADTTASSCERRRGSPSASPSTRGTRFARWATATIPAATAW